MWWKKIPHPTYGYFCGRSNNGDAFGEEKPIDALDQACYWHDYHSYRAKQIVDEYDRKFAQKEVDRDFGKALRKDLKPYAHKIKGPLYRFFASLVFRP